MEDGALRSVVVRFPDGSREFRYPEKMLKEGDVIWHDGRNYRVVGVFSEDGHGPVVTVEAEPEDLGDLLQSERGGIQLVPIQ
jgi:hypothetical protein